MCTGDTLHRLRLQNHLLFSELSRLSKLPSNVLRGMENDYIKMCSCEIFCLAQAFGVPYIALCNSWREVEECLEFKLEEVFEAKPAPDLRRGKRKGFYVPGYCHVNPWNYKLSVLAEMSSYYRKNILGVKIDLMRLSKRLGVTVSVNSVTLATVCDIAFHKGLNLAYVLSGEDLGGITHENR